MTRVRRKNPAERREGPPLSERIRGDIIDKLVDRFLAWPLPDSVCSDPCASKSGYPHRSGTNLLTADEARQMFKHLFAKPL